MSVPVQGVPQVTTMYEVVVPDNVYPGTAFQATVGGQLMVCAHCHRKRRLGTLCDDCHGADAFVCARVV